MEGSENCSNCRNKEGGVPGQQKEAGRKSAAKSTVIVPSPQSRTVVGFGDGAAVALNAFRTGEGEKDCFDNRKAYSMTDLDVGGGEGSSSAISNRAKMRKRFHNVPEGDDFLFPCHASYISKGPGENPSCNDLQLEYVKPVIDNVNGSVMIPSDIVNTGSIPFSRALYGFFIEENEIDFASVNSRFRKMWKTHGIEDIMVNDKGFYFFKFKSDEGMLQALEHGPWTISNTNSPIFLKRWTPGLILEKSKHDKLKLPVWIRIYGMPLELWNKNGLNIIASMLGNPLAVDSCTARMCMNASGRAGYARVLVDFEAAGNWPEEISVSVPYGNGFSMSTLRIKYSWKPGKCSFCKVFDHTDSNCIHQKVMAKYKYSQLNEISLKKEQEERENKRSYKAHPHSYAIVKVVRDEDLLEQIGKDIYFDLVDHDKVHSFHVSRQLPIDRFKERVAEEFGVPVQFQRFWLWGKRENQTYRPLRPLKAKEETQTVGQLSWAPYNNDKAELILFLEIGIDPELHPLENKRDDILVFFKVYDPEKEQLRYVGRLFVKSSGKPSEIISKLNERAGFSPDEEIELYEEIASKPHVMCERVDKEASFKASLIEDGDIICFQKLSQAQAVDKYRYPNVPSFFEKVKSRPELQCLKRLKVIFHHATKEEPVIHSIRMPKHHTVGDVLSEIKTKVELSRPDAELRLLQLFYHKICKIVPLTEKIENINDEHWMLRAEEIPEEEKNMGPKDQLIHVYHFCFTKANPYSRIRQMHNIGEPFFLVIHESETLAAVKVRIQKKLEVPDDEFSKWRFAFVSLGCPEYLQDSDVVSVLFQRRGLYENREQYLGLDTTPNHAL